MNLNGDVRCEIDTIMKILRWELTESSAPEELSHLPWEVEGNFDRMYAILQRHSLEHLLCDAAWKVGVFTGDGQNERRQFLKKQRMRAIYRYTYRDAALSSISDAFAKEKIPYLPIKGAVLQNLWPEPWMRTCCDIDIMVKKEDFDHAKACLMGSLGYSYLGRSSHDISLLSSDAGDVRVELHFDTIEEEYIEKARRVLEDLWSYTIETEEEFRLALSPEMFYFYHIAHMAKHFQHGGCGIRPFLDLFLMQQKMPMDESRKIELLREGGLLRFHDACNELAGVWMNDMTPSPMTSALEEYILGGGTYGNIENMVAVRRQQKKSYIFSRLFPPFSSMKERYPSLQKFPFLLPGMYLHRIFKMIARGRMYRTVKELSSLHGDHTKEKDEQIKTLLGELGLFPEERK